MFFMHSPRVILHLDSQNFNFCSWSLQFDEAGLEDQLFLLDINANGECNFVLHRKRAFYEAEKGVAL